MTGEGGALTDQIGWTGGPPCLVPLPLDLEVHIIRMSLFVVAVLLASGGLYALAEGPPPAIPGIPAASSHPDNWFLLTSSIASGLFTVLYAWVMADNRGLKRRADDADRNIKELVAHLEHRTQERDIWMQRAYNHGYRDSEELRAIPPETPVPNPPVPAESPGKPPESGG